jgi:hypothetical protein
MEIDGEDQGGKTGCRTGRRRDSSHHVELYQDKLILPYLDIDLKYNDLGMESRDALTSAGRARP